MEILLIIYDVIYLNTWVMVIMGSFEYVTLTQKGQISLNLELNQAYIEWILGHILIFEWKPLSHVFFVKYNPINFDDLCQSIFFLRKVNMP